MDALARRRILAALMLAAAGLAGCGDPPDDSPRHQISERLAGTWLREYDEDGTRVRRVLVLRPDGTFLELSVVTPAQAQAPVAKNEHEGEWSFDGTNLKRHYTRVNGEPPSRLRPPFATFELRFESRDEFVGVDNVHRRRVVYRRVGEGTLP
jgi:hypothetical protein